MSRETKRTVFVLMPFDDELVGGVYEELVTWAFRGFTVNRADDLEDSSQQNILKDVIDGIDKADVVVADLTDLNANVFYELGIAHAMQKDVVMITQDRESVPFDLRSYRVLEYDLRLGKIGAAKQELRKVAEDIARGKTQFGSPFSDFRPRRRTKRESGSRKEKAATSKPTPPGLIDNAVSIQEGLRSANKVTQEITRHIEEIGDEAAANTPKVEGLSKAQDFKALRALLRAMASRYTNHASSIRELTKKFRIVWSDVAIAMEGIAASPATAEEDYADALTSAGTLKKSAEEGVAGLDGLLLQMRNVPAMERSFDKAKQKLMGELERFRSDVAQVASLEARIAGVKKRRGVR